MIDLNKTVADKSTTSRLRKKSPSTRLKLGFVAVVVSELDCERVVVIEVGRA